MRKQGGVSRIYPENIPTVTGIITIHKYKYTNTNTQIQLLKYKYSTTNTRIQKHSTRHGHNQRFDSDEQKEKMYFGFVSSHTGEMYCTVVVNEPSRVKLTSR